MSINVAKPAETQISDAMKTAMGKALHAELEARGVNLKNAGKQVKVANVERSGVAITIPPNMTIPQAMKVLESRMKYEEETTNIMTTFDAFPWDGAVALHRVLERKYGWSEGIPTPGFFGDKPPQMRNVEIGYGKNIQVPWGRMQVPGIDGYLETNVAEKNDMAVFHLSAVVKRKDEATIAALFQEVRNEVKSNSIYRGQAIKIRFVDDDGDRIPLPEPIFLDVESIDDSTLVYSDDVMDSVQTNLFTPIEHVRECLDNGISFKRGVLLGGTYGTGKTLAATVASKKAVKQGLTYIYVPRANELKFALAFAQHYQSPAAVVFCEDIDRVTSGERNISMDDVLNMLDGIDNKTANVMVVLTTNDLDAMNPAMMRPGRLDAVIEVTPPDAKAVEKLLRLYARGLIKPETDLTAAGIAMKGHIPAVIAEVIKRAKLAQMRYLKPGERMTELTELAVLSASKSMQAQTDLLQRLIEASKPIKADPLSQAFAQVITDRGNGRFNALIEQNSAPFAAPDKKRA